MGDWTAEKILAAFAEREWRIHDAHRVEMTDIPGGSVGVEVYSDSGRLLHEAEITSPGALFGKMARFTAGLMKEAAGQTTLTR